MIDWLQALLIVNPGALASCGETYESIERFDGLPVPPREQLEAAWAAYTPPAEWRSDVFWSRFTADEQVALVTAAKGSDARGVQCELLRMSLVTSPAVRSDSPRLQSGMAMLVSFGLLTSERAAAILNPGL